MSCFLLFIVTWVYAPWFFVSSQQRFGLTDIKAPSACHSSQVLDRPCYSSQVSKGPCYSSEKSVLQFNVTALFYSEDSRKIHLWGVRAHRSKDARRRALQCAGEREKERASERALAPLFICFFCFVLFLSSQEFLPEVLTPVLGPSFVLFSWAYPFFVF